MSLLTKQSLGFCVALARALIGKEVLPQSYALEELLWLVELGEGNTLVGAIMTSLEEPSGHLLIPTREPDSNFRILYSDPPGIFLALVPWPINFGLVDFSQEQNHKLVIA